MKKLGTFLGVFTPTVLTILGVILYLRLGWVVGNVGVGRTLGIVLLANTITFITTLSFSAIATNTRVGVGGAYYMISRSLGLEFGGAIGLPLFLSQACSVTLYAFGLAEALRILWPDVPVQGAAFIIVGGVTALAFRGASLALRAQIPLMALIAVSIAALALGAFRSAGIAEDVTAPTLAAVSATPVGFWAVFAVFFPAVTGVMAGLGLSGDLENPTRSIPRGAVAASLVGLAVYLAVPLLLARGASPEALRNDPLVWTSIAPLGAWLVLPGLFGAVLSSAIGSVLTAPRTIQALSVDGLAPRFLARARKGGEPVGGLLATLAIALLTVLLGDLNTVAPVVAMFFLTVYGMVNFVAALESLSGDPSWRPHIRVPWPVSLVGALACFSVMFLIHPLAAAVAILLEAALWVWLERQERRARWGDVRRGIYESLIRWSLDRLSEHPMSARNWRPHVLVFAGHVERRLDLIRFATWFSQGRGVVTVCELVVGDLLTEDFRRRERRTKIQSLLKKERIRAFGEVDVVRDIVSGIVDVSQSNGIAGMDSNTILLGWPDDSTRLVSFLNAVRRLERLNKSVVIGRIQPELIPRPGERRTIHVWWGGLQRNSDLMLLLAHLLTRNREWRDSTVLVRSIASNELMQASTRTYLERLIPEIRIDADIDVQIRKEGMSIRDAITSGSSDADVVFLGLDPPKDEAKLPEYVTRLDHLASPLRTVFFVKNASLFVGGLVQESAAEATAQQTATEKAAAGEPDPEPDETPG